MIQAFRGVGKSFVTGAYVVWLLWRDPQHKIMVVSASKDRADAFSIFVKRLIEDMPGLEHLKPRPEQRSSNVSFDVGPATTDQSPSVKSVGISGQLTGSRAGTIVADDIEVMNNSQTVVQREKLSERIKEFDAVLVPGGQIVYLGTPQSFESVYAHLPERGYSIRIWPARYPKDQQHREQYGDFLAPFIAEPFDADPGIAWTPVEPRRFHEADLIEREASYGRSGFMLQFMLDTTLSDADRYPLKLSDLIVTDVDREVAPVRIVWSSAPELSIPEIPIVGFTGDRLYRPMHVSKEVEEFEGAVMTIDPSGRGADSTGFAVTKMLRSMIYLRRAGGLDGGYDLKTLETIANIARAEKVHLIKVEKNFGDGMFTALLQPVLNRIYPCNVEEVHSVGQKERRIIDTLEPVLNSHRLVVDAAVLKADQKAVENRQVFYQLTRITRDRGALRHDDALEAVSMGVAHWTAYLSRCVEDEEARHQEEQLMKQYEEFMAQFGLGAGPPNYLDTY